MTNIEAVILFGGRLKDCREESSDFSQKRPKVNAHMVCIVIIFTKSWIIPFLAFRNLTVERENGELIEL